MLSPARQQAPHTLAIGSARTSRQACQASQQQASPAGKSLARIPSREPRKAAQPPAPVPVQHSSTYLVRGEEPAPEASTSSRQEEEDEEPFAGNALQWGLRKLDARLNEKEQNPTASDRAAWQLGSGPVGVSAAKGVSKAAQLSLTAGQKVIKAAVPVGQIALGRGAGLAWKLLRGGKHKKNSE